MLLASFYCFYFKFIYFEREGMSRGGAERERERERERKNHKQAPNSTELDVGLELTNCDIMTSAETD